MASDGKEDGGKLAKQSDAGQLSDATIQELTDGITQLQTGLELLQKGLELTASGAQKRLQNEFSSIGDQALRGMEGVIGKEQLAKQLEEAREAVLQNIGISEEDVPPVTGPPFQLSDAIFLAGSAFDSYNDPTGGIVASYEDGVKVAYTSSRMLSEAHSGVLLIKIKKAELTPGKGVMGSEAEKCDPYVRIKVNGAVTDSKTVKNTLKPEFDETVVMYVGPTDTDRLEIQLYDADILMGNDDLRQWTPDPLVGLAEIPMKELASVEGWQELEVNLKQPPEPMTSADDQNRNNPFWAKIPREFLIQSWPSLLSGGAVGGKLYIEAQFLPLESSADGEEAPGLEAREVEAVQAAAAESLQVNEWELLSSATQDVTVDASLFAKEHLEKLCYIDNDETDTQVVLWEDRQDKRLIIAFRGTEQIKWKDFLTDALITQQPFEPGTDPSKEIDLPPLLRSATSSVRRRLATDAPIPATSPQDAGAGDAGMIVGAGSLSSVMDSMQTGSGVTDVLLALTGGGNSSIGDTGIKLMRELTGNPEYEFGDLSKKLVKELTGKEEYQFGDITKSLFGKLSKEANQYQLSSLAQGAFGGLWGGAQAEKEQQQLEASDVEMVHVGFLRAYLSVRHRLLDILDVLRLREEEPWTVYVTGHSLGGALATICAADVAALYDREVVMYNFGSPRVGNMAFVNRFNKLVPNAFRVVNDADLVARVPRSRLMNYHHVARTVLVSAKQQQNVWVEGESEGQDPLKERWIDLNALVDAEMTLLQALVNGESLGDHMEDAYFLALRQAISKSSAPA